MAAQVEVQTGEVGRTGVGGRLHLSPLADSSNKSQTEGPTNTQGSLIITPESSKPVPAPKPRLTPKPFAVEKTPTIRPILAPKPNTKPRPEPTRPTFYKPDPPNGPKPQQPNVTSKHRPVSTNHSRPAPTSYKPSPKLSTGQTTKPVAQPFKPAPLTLGDPRKPTPSQTLGRQKPAAAGLSHSQGPKKPPSVEWSGSTKQEKECGKTASSIRAGGAYLTRTKSMGFLRQIGLEGEERKEDEGPEVTVQLRTQSTGSRPRPVSAIFLPSPTQSESFTPADRWVGRRPLSADLTSKFESIGLSLHRGCPTKTVSKENTPEEGALLRTREGETGAEGTIVTPQAPDSKPSALARGSEKKKEVEKDEGKGGGSIKRRISLLLDSSSSSPVVSLRVAAQGPEPHSPGQPVPEADVPLGGVKQRIKKLTEDTVTPPAQTLAVKPHPLPPDLTKRFGSEKSTDLGSPSPSKATDRHESDTDPQGRGKDSVFIFSDQRKVDEHTRGSKEQPTQTSSDPSAGRTAAQRGLEIEAQESHPSSGVQTVRAALFENVVERHSVLLMEEDRAQSNTKSCPKRSVSLKLGDGEKGGSLVTSPYREPVSPSSPLRVEHLFDTVHAVGERRAVSESVPSAQLEDKAMTLRSRHSDGNRPARAEPVEKRPARVQGDLSSAQRGAPASQHEQGPRYLRVGALQKWNTAEVDRGAEVEKGRLGELERERLGELERERLGELERERLGELERQKEFKRERQRQFDLERQKKLEIQRVEELEEIKEMERRQLFRFEKQKQAERERQQLLELEKQILRENMEREEQEKMRQQAIQQEVDQERQRESERERQRESERERQRESERERQSVEELEIIKKLERRQLFEKQNERERQQLQKQRLREKMEKEEQENMRQVARQQEAERQRILERQRRENQERVVLDSLLLRPKVLDLDSVSLGVLHSRGSPHSPGARWKHPSPRGEDHYRPGILDIDSFRSQTQTQPSSTREVFPIAGIKGSDPGSGVRSHTPERDVSRRVGAVGRPSPVWAPSQQELWEQRLGFNEESVDRPMAGPEPPRKPANKPSLEQLLHRQLDRATAPILVPERRWSGMPSEASFPRREPYSPGSPMEQTWFPQDSEPQGHRVEARGQRRSQGYQELNRMRSRSVSRRSAPSESAVEGSLSRMRSRSAHRERDRQSWEQLKQSVDGEEEGRDIDTLVHETDSQYGTWETGLRTDDSLTPATPTSDSNLSQSPRKPIPPHTPGEHAPHSDLDTPDGFSPSVQPEMQLLPFPEASTILLDSSALRSRVQLSKMRGPRSRPSRVARQTAAMSVHLEGQTAPTEDWRSRDSTEDNIEFSKQEDSDSEEQERGVDPRSAAASSQPQRVALFPGMDPSALKAQLKKRGDSDNQTDGAAPSPSQLSRSPKSPFLPQASRVLPPSGGKENGEEASPQWLRELKSKKRSSQYENDS
ncbi:inner centromere protein [Salvelinus namaycush]|uniref:Inner centromere protein n=1 Tax=Salvelinus namaycush TaxID=8040 RepID=A0A8U1H348_SALNM|nr:inner centromere protein [Salvelinus namaycush]